MDMNGIPPTIENPDPAILDAELDMADIVHNAFRRIAGQHI